MADERISLPRAAASDVVFVWAVESTDVSGELLALEPRRRASREAQDEHEAGGARWLRARAERLAQEVGESWPLSASVRRWSDPIAGWWPLLMLAALIVGLATNALGPSRQINVIAAPLLLLILWNVAVLLTMLLVSLWPKRGDEPARPWLLRVLEQRLRSWIARRAKSEDPLESQVLTAFVDRWLRCVAPLMAARLRLLLHLAALLMVGGAVAGMYVRGLLFEYQATWESTFLSAQSVDAVLAAVLRPAAWLGGAEVPSALAIQRPASGPAAPWIHLYGLSAALWVGIPRLLMILLESLKVARFSRWLPVDLPKTYVRRLLASISTAEHLAQIVPYSYQPAEKPLRHLKEALLDLMGARAQLRTAPVVNYGAEPVEAFDGSLRVVLFGLAQTPEVEVHGQWVTELKESLVDGQSLLVVVDESGFLRRITAGPAASKRLDERRRAWTRVLASTGVEPLLIDLEQGIESSLELISRSIWPRSERWNI